jgi:hypothetical protein
MIPLNRLPQGNRDNRPWREVRMNFAAVASAIPWKPVRTACASEALMHGLYWIDDCVSAIPKKNRRKNYI